MSEAILSIQGHHKDENGNVPVWELGTNEEGAAILGYGMAPPMEFDDNDDIVDQSPVTLKVVAYFDPSIPAEVAAALLIGMIAEGEVVAASAEVQAKFNR